MANFVNKLFFYEHPPPPFDIKWPAPMEWVELEHIREVLGYTMMTKKKTYPPLVALNFHQPQVAENYSYLFNLRSKMEMLMLKDKLHSQQQGFNYLLIKWILNLSPHDALKHHFTSLKNELITYT